MNELQQFEVLAMHARGDVAPQVNVASQVLRDIRRMPATPVVTAPMLIFSGLSLAVASIVLMLAVDSWTAAIDPLSSLFDTLTMVMQ